jgi:Rrf2 family iron-sulfur cluster assembly transcriptional regulator
MLDWGIMVGGVMHLGSKGRYAIIAVIDIAQNGRNGAVPLSDVSQRQDVSVSYLEQLFALLRRAGVVTSARGPGGGYRLAQSPEELTIWRIVQAVGVAAGSEGSETPGERGGGLVGGLWIDIERHMTDYLNSVTVADVLAGRTGASWREDQLSPDASMV